MLVERFAIAGRDVLSTREPGGTAMGDAVRTIFLDRTLEIAPLSEAFLANASAHSTLRKSCVRRLAAGQIGAVRSLHRFDACVSRLRTRPRPRCVAQAVRLCVGRRGARSRAALRSPVEAVRKRLEERAFGEDRIEREDDGFHQRVRHGYLELAKTPRHRIIDATQPAQAVADEAWNYMRYTFDVIGAAGPRQYFGSLTRETLAHAYLFTGAPGVGKKTFARRLAQSLLCTTPKAGVLATTAPVRVAFCSPPRTRAIRTSSSTPVR